MERDVFQAIADPTRRAILGLLARQAMTPNALAAHFPASRQAVSKHLKVLAGCQLLLPQPAGREIRYHFNPAKMQEVARWLESFQQHWADKLTGLDELLQSTTPTPQP